MAITTPKGEQIQFVSSKTGTHNLDTYLEAAELGNRQLHDLLDDMFDATTGVFKADNFQFRYDSNSADKKLQIRVGQFASGNSGWTDITSFFNVRGTFSTSDAYNNFDLVLDSNKDLYLVHGLLTQNNTFSSESNFISNANTTKIVDVSLAQDWAKKTNGLVDGTGYSSKAWAVGGTGVTATASGGSSREWATTTGSPVDTSEYSSREYAIGTTVPTGSAKEWATDTSGVVSSNEYSAKEYAQGTQSGTGGSAKSWSQDTDQVNGASTNDRSAKSWAQGSNMTGATLGGSAKDWAQLTGSTVDGSNYSAKYWATHPDVTTVVSNISDINALALKTTELGLLGTTTVVGNLGQLGTSTVVGHMANLNATNVISNIGTVAGQISPTNNIATVAGANANITALTQSGVISNIGTVAGQISPTNNIQTVAGLQTEIAAVAGISSEIQTVHTNIAKVQTAADDLLETTSEIDTVATSIGNVDAVGTNIGSVNAISPHIANVNTVATNINNVNSFFDIYSVASSNPTTNLNAGDLVFNTTTSTLNVYDGANWQSTAEAAQRTLTSHTVTSSEQTAGTVTVSATYTVGLVDVYLNGLHLGTSDFTATNGTSVTIASPTAGDIIDVVALSSFNAANYGLMAARNNVSESDLNIAGSPTDGYFLKADSSAAGGLVWDQVDTSAKLSLSGGTMTGALDMGNNNITTTGKVLFANMYSQTSDLPSATTYHGMFAHVHGTGKAYYAHANAWVELANNSQLANSSNWDTAYGWGDHGSAGYLTTSSASSTYLTQSNASSTYLPLAGGTLTGDLSGANVTLSGYLRGPSTFTIDPSTHGNNTGTVIVKGDLQVEGTTTTVDSTTVNIADNLITLASGNTGDYFSADGSGIEVGMGTHPNWFIKIFAEAAYWHISHSTLISGDLAFEENVGNGNGGSGPQTGGNIFFPQGAHRLSWSGVKGAYIKAHTGGSNITYATNRIEFNVGTGEVLRLDGNQNAMFGGSGEMTLGSGQTTNLGSSNSAYYGGAALTIYQPTAGKGSQISLRSQNTGSAGTSGTFLSHYIGNTYFINQDTGGSIYFFTDNSSGTQEQIAQFSSSGFTFSKPFTGLNITNSTSGQLTLNSNSSASSSDYMLEFQRSGVSEWWIKANSGWFAIHENGSGDHFTINSGGGVDISQNLTFTNNNHVLQSYNSGNPEILTGQTGTTSTGFLIRNSAGNNPIQLYRSGTDYGFLGTAWGAWDIRKTVGGNLYLNDNTTYYLNPASTSYLNNADIWNNKFAYLRTWGGSYGNSGQVLTSGGSGAAASWQDAGGGAWEVIGNYTGTNTNSLDFVDGLNNFVFNSTTYKWLKMYAVFWNSSSGGTNVDVYPLVGSTSSYAPMNNLVFVHENRAEMYPEFANVTYGSYQWGKDAQYANNNQGKIIFNARLSENVNGGSGMGSFNETIAGTNYYSNNRFYASNFTIEMPTKGITTNYGMQGKAEVWYDQPSLYSYHRYYRWQLFNRGYGKVGFRFVSSSSNNFDYDITWIGLKP